MRITALENFRRMIEHRSPEWLPLDLTFTPPVAKRLQTRMRADNLHEAFGTDFRYIGFGRDVEETRWRAAFASLGYSLPENAEIDPIGVAHAVPPAETLGEATHFRTMLHPLETVTDIHQLESLPWPEWVPPGSVDRMRADAAAQHERGHVVAASCECTLFEHAWYLRGMDNLFMDLVEDNGIAPWLLDHFTERSIAVCRAYVEAGADVIGLGDDVGTQRGMMMSLADWRTHLRPRLKRVIDAIRDAQTDRPVAIRYHSDGDIRAILDDLVQIGVDILNPVQPECMPVDDVVSQHRDRLGFWGIMGTQTTMPFGSPQDVRGVVDDCVRRAAEGAAIVLAPTHVLEPDVPDENTIALATADRRIGLVAAEQ